MVAFYLIAQMVGAGQLIKLLFGLDYRYAVIIVGVLMIIYVTFGGMIATTWVQIIKAVPAAGRRDLHGGAGAGHFGFSSEALFAKAVAGPSQAARQIMAPGRPASPTRSRRSRSAWR